MAHKFGEWKEPFIEVTMSNQTTAIKKIAEEVYQTLASGFSKDVYDRAMQVGLRLTKIDDRRAALPLTQKKYMFQAVGLRNARA